MKRFISIIISLCLACTLFTTAFATDYYPRYSGNSESIVDALESVGEDGSYSNRELIASQNGIADYTGSASQNQLLLSLLKQGRLVRSNTDKANTPSRTDSVGCFPAYKGGSSSIVDALDSMGINSSFTYRASIAAANGIAEYSGTASENELLLNYLKRGILRNPASANDNISYDITTPISINNSYDLSIRENFGYENRIYLVDRDQISVRTEPYVTGEKITSLTRGTPILGKGLYTNSKGNNWVQLIDESGQVCWVFSKYLKEHTVHDYVDLDDYGFEGFQVCKQCGSVHYTKPLNENGGIELNTSDKAHLALAACSFAPLVGNFCDAGDALLSLYEGDYVGFAINLAAMIPLLGYAADAGKTVKVLDTADDVSVTVRAIKGSEIIEIVGVNNRSLINGNMAVRYELTKDIRFLKRLGMAGHHIVEFSDQSEASKAARQIMEQYNIDLNSADNGVYLCSNPAMCFDVGGALHTGRHVSSYSETVLQRLESALENTSSLSMKEQRDALIDALDQIARDLMRNDLRLQNVA